MALNFSRNQVTQEPGSKHRELDSESQVHLESSNAKIDLHLSPKQKTTLFTNGWFCKKCGCLTEHRKLHNQEVCVECGSILGYKKPFRKQKKYYLKNYRQINIKNWSPEQAAEFSKSILQQFKEYGE